MQTSYTAYDTTGQTKLTDTDQLMEQRRRELADQAFRGALLNNQNSMQREGWDRQGAMTREGWGRDDARFNQNMSAQERIAAANNANQLAMNGSYGDRSTQATKLAEMQMGPARMAQELEATKWGEGAGLRKSQNDWQQKLNDMRSSLFDSPAQGSAPAAMGQDPNSGETTTVAPARSGADPSMRLKLALLGINPQAMEDPEDVMMRQATNQILQKKLADGEIDIPQFKAARSGDFSGIPKRSVSAISPEQQIAALQGDVEQFGQKDAATFGFDPVEEDVQRLVAQRDLAAKALKSQNPRLSDEEALNGANFYIEQSLKKNGTDQRWGTGWIARLREALAGKGNAAPVERDTGLNMGEWQG